MRRVETLIRTTELGLALGSTYLTALTLLQASLYAKIRPVLLRYGESVLEWLLLDLAYFDLSVLALALMLSLLFWRRGDEAGFGRLFSLNMIMFFPSVIDFSMFNWANLILPYDPAPRVSSLWMFGVGLLLQATYITLRSTVRFRGLRQELLGRGAEVEDVDNVSKGQMTYLALLMAGTAVTVASIYYITCYIMPLKLLRFEAEKLPYPYIVIGIVCSILIAAATIIYLRGYGPRSADEKRVEPLAEPEGQAHEPR